MTQLHRAARRTCRLVSGMGRAARRSVFLRHDRRVRPPRQHLRPLSRSARRRDAALRRARGVSGRAAVRPLVARAALRPGPRPARLRRARRAAAEGHGRAREQEGRRPERAAQGSGRDLRAARPVRPQQHHGGRGRSAQRGVDHGSGVVRVPVGRAGPPEPAGVVAARDDAELGDEPARQAAEHGVRAGGREAGGPERSAHRQPARRDDRGAAAGRERRASAFIQAATGDDAAQATSRISTRRSWRR